MNKVFFPTQELWLLLTPVDTNFNILWFSARTESSTWSRNRASSCCRSLPFCFQELRGRLTLEDPVIALSAENGWLRIRWPQADARELTDDMQEEGWIPHHRQEDGSPLVVPVSPPSELIGVVNPCQHCARRLHRIAAPQNVFTLFLQAKRVRFTNS